MRPISTVFAVGLLAASTLPVHAGMADVEAVEVSKEGNGYRFSVTVRHADEGWEHYADKWEVLGPDGAVYGERVLLHPHVDEQPFTRSQTGIVVPEGIGEVTVRAHDKLHGWGGIEIKVKLPDR